LRFVRSTALRKAPRSIILSASRGRFAAATPTKRFPLSISQGSLHRNEFTWNELEPITPFLAFGSPYEHFFKSVLTEPINGFEDTSVR
jgi:hypothetical protein